MSNNGELGGATVCEACGMAVPDYDVVSYGSIEQGYRTLCTRCFNAEIAQMLGLEHFEHLQLEPVVMTDCAGEQHEFHFRTSLLGEFMVLEAFELKAGGPSGYQFEILGDPGGELLSLLGRLIERMRRSLSVQYLEKSENGVQVAGRTVCGRIEWDETGDDRTPLLVIDGQEITWDDFGHMMMTFEGWQFRLVIRDRSEEP